MDVSFNFSVPFGCNLMLSKQDETSRLTPARDWVGGYMGGNSGDALVHLLKHYMAWRWQMSRCNEKHRAPL